MNAGYFVFFVLYLVSLVIRTGYEMLKDAGRVSERDRIPFAIVFAAMCLMWISWFNLKVTP